MGGKVKKCYYVTQLSCKTSNKEECSIPKGTKKSFELNVDNLGDFIK